MPELAKTPSAPYYAVIFASQRRDTDVDGYAETAERMLHLAAQQPGFLGVDSARSGAVGITVSYWENEEAIRAWKMQVEHSEARRQGRKRWYAAYSLRVARVERAYDFLFGG